MAFISSLLLKKLKCQFFKHKYIVIFCFTVFHRYCFFFFNKLKFCSNSVLIKSLGIIFPSAFAHFLSLCHILVIPAIFQTFSFCYIYYYLRPKPNLEPRPNSLQFCEGKRGEVTAEENSEAHRNSLMKFKETRCLQKHHNARWSSKCWPRLCIRLSRGPS